MGDESGSDWDSISESQHAKQTETINIKGNISTYLSNFIKAILF